MTQLVCISFFCLIFRLTSLTALPMLFCVYGTATYDESFRTQDDVNSASCTSYANISRDLSSLGAASFCGSNRTLYMMYDVKSGEGFHLQKEVLYRAALLIRSLNLRRCTLQHGAKSRGGTNRIDKSNCITFVLVLPPWCRIQHWGLDKTYRLPWNVFFDISKLRDVVPVVEYDVVSRHSDLDILKVAQPVDVVVGAGFKQDDSCGGVDRCTCGDSSPHLDSSTAESDSVQWITTRCSDYPSCCTVDADAMRNCCWLRRQRLRQGDNDGGYSFWFGGYCNCVRALGAWCVRTRNVSPEGISDVISRSVVRQHGISVLFLKSAEGMFSPFPYELRAADLQDVLLIHPVLRLLAEAFISQHFSVGTSDYLRAAKSYTAKEVNLGASRYVSFHLRRADFVRLGRSPSLQDAAIAMARVMDAVQITKVKTVRLSILIASVQCTISASTRRADRLAGSLLSSQAFVCTDAGPEERDSLIAALASVPPPEEFHRRQIVFFSSVQAMNALPSEIEQIIKQTMYLKTYSEHPGMQALVEVWIAVLADVFVGTHESRFSHAIRWERLLSGFSFMSSGSEFCKPGSRSSTQRHAYHEVHADWWTGCTSREAHVPVEFEDMSSLRSTYWGVSREKESRIRSVLKLSETEYARRTA